MTERVEEIRRRLDISQRFDPEIERLLAALAQAEREREAALDRVAAVTFERDKLRAEVERLLIENDAARKSIGEAWDTAVADGAKIRSLGAEVERLKNDLADALDVKAGSGPTALSMVVARAEHAEADLARVRAALKEMADCCQYPEHDDSRLDYISVQVDRDTLAKARAALEGR